jgi:hypothetical protein
MILASTKPPLSPLLCFDLRIEGDVRQQSVPDAMKESHELLSSSPVHNNLSNFTCGAQSWTTCSQAFMEQWPSNQTIIFEGTPGRVGDPHDTCVKGKTDPKQCQGIAGLAKTEVSTINSYDTTGLTLAFEDDWFTENMTRLQESILAVAPDDWDILRFVCWGHVPSGIPFLHVEPKNESQIKKVETRHNEEQPPCNATKERGCYFCGGTHAMVWCGGESVQKLRKLWSRIPYNGVDRLLTSLAAERHNVTSCCVNFRRGGSGGHSQRNEGGGTHQHSKEQWLTSLD